MNVKDVCNDRPSRAASLGACLAWAAPAAIYAAGLGAAAWTDGETMGQVVCYDLWRADHAATLRWAIAAVIATSGLLATFVAPWLLGVAAVQRVASKRRVVTDLAAGAWSVAANTLVLVVVCAVLRATVGIDRGGFCLAWLLWCGGLLALAGGPYAAMLHARQLLAPWWRGLLVGLAAATVSIAIFAPQQFGQCFEGDGTEQFELARSLRQHFLPYWEIESLGRLGNSIAHPAVVESYWTLASQVVLGENEFGTRIVFWLGWLGVFAAALVLVGNALRGVPGAFSASGDVVGNALCDVPRRSTAAPGTERHGGRSLQTDGHMVVPLAERHGVGSQPGRYGSAVALGIALFLISLWYTFHTGYYPYMTDVAGPGVPDGVLTLLFILSLAALEAGDAWAWAMMLVLCSLTSYAGPVLFALSGAAALLWQPIPRQRMLRAILGSAVLMAAIVAAYGVWGWMNGWLTAWAQTLVEEPLKGFVPPMTPSISTATYAGYFLLSVGGVAVAGLVLPFLNLRLGKSSGGLSECTPHTPCEAGLPECTPHTPCEAGLSERTPHTPCEAELTDLTRSVRSTGGWQRTVATTVLLYLLLILAARHKSLHYLPPLAMIVVVLWLQGACHRGASSTIADTRNDPRRRDRVLLTVFSLLIAVGLSWPKARPQFTLNHELGQLTTFQADCYGDAIHLARLVYPLHEAGLISWRIGLHTWVQYSACSTDPHDLRPLVVSRGPPPTPDYALIFDSPGHGKLYSRGPEWAEWLKNQHPIERPAWTPWLLRGGE